MHNLSCAAKMKEFHTSFLHQMYLVPIITISGQFYSTFSLLWDKWNAEYGGKWNSACRTKNLFTKGIVGAVKQSSIFISGCQRYKFSISVCRISSTYCLTTKHTCRFHEKWKFRKQMLNWHLTTLTGITVSNISIILHRYLRKLLSGTHYSLRQA